MKELLEPLAALAHGLAPDWVALPNLTFSLPHSVYWLGLLLFPPLAMFLVYRAQRAEPRRVSAAIAYLLWLWGGFVGLHRFYLRSPVFGLVYVALFALLLTGNNIAATERNAKSALDNKLKIAEFMVKRQETAVERGRSGAEAALETAIGERDAAARAAQAANADLERWRTFVGTIFYLIVIFLLIDAVLIPGLVKRAEVMEKGAVTAQEIEIMQRGSKGDARDAISTPLIRAIERVSGWSGHFVAYWSVLAVFVYYYEVIARYVFNAPTNWAHESMFLMFGMQYLLSGAYAYRENAHVRVDVIYEKFSVRSRALIDIATSIVFFIFAATLIVTGYFFARDAVAVTEVSFTEWAIQYWPVKITIVIGGVLLLLQGLAKLMRDVIFLTRAETAGGA